MDSVVTALTSAASDVATSALSAITGILPVVLPIMGAIVIISLGYSVIKRFGRG